MFKELKEAVGKGLKEIREMIYEQNVNISKDKNYKKEPNRNSELEKYNNQNEKSTMGFNSVFEQGEENIGKCENRSIEII